jgi:general stress protein YciG
MIARYGSEEAWHQHMREIAAKGGASGSHTRRGFANGEAGRELARIAGAKGGRVRRKTQ